MEENEKGEFVRVYPEMNIDTLAWAIFASILGDADAHGDFDIFNEDFDIRAAALVDDVSDLIHNGNQYDWLVYFASAEDRMHQEIGGVLQFRLDCLLGLDGDLDGAGQRADWNSYATQIDELAQRVATMLDHRGSIHSFGLEKSWYKE